MNLCSHSVSNCPVCRRASGRCCRPAMALPRNEQGRSVSCQCRSSTISTSKTISRTTGSQGNKCLICWRWRVTSFSGVLSAQPAPIALQRSNRGKCAQKPRDFAATAELPPHSALFSQQLQDLTHRWSEAEGPDIDVGDVYPLATAVYICINLHSARYPDPASPQLPDPQQPARSLTDLLTTRCYSWQAPASQRSASAFGSGCA